VCRHCERRFACVCKRESIYAIFLNCSLKWCRCFEEIASFSTVLKNRNDVWCVFLFCHCELRLALCVSVKQSTQFFLNCTLKWYMCFEEIASFSSTLKNRNDVWCVFLFRHCERSFGFVCKREAIYVKLFFMLFEMVYVF